MKSLPCEALVYGRLPLMVTENCLISNALGCKSHDLNGPCGGGHVLTDRRGESFPVLPVFGCRSEVQNAKTLFLSDKPEYRRCGLSYARLRFTTEPPEDCVRVLAGYQDGSCPAPEDFTRGLFYRGVE
jgi:putative protease